MSHVHAPDERISVSDEELKRRWREVGRHLSADRQRELEHGDAAQGSAERAYVLTYKAMKERALLT